MLPEPFKRLVQNLMRLPGVGDKTATRLAHHLLRVPREDVETLAQALLDVRDKLKPCPECGNLTDLPLCFECSDATRERSKLCVVERPADIQPIERSGAYRGLYHVLGGSLSPLKGVQAEHLRIAPLVERVRQDKFDEVILATDADVEGEATAHYLERLLSPLGVRVTRLATGLPVGGDLEYADALTLGQALKGRHEM